MGMEVEIDVGIDVYVAEGRYQLVVKKITRCGISQAHLQFLMLRDELHKKGYFDKALKKSIKNVKDVGIITFT